MEFIILEPCLGGRDTGKDMVKWLADLNIQENGSLTNSMDMAKSGMSQGMSMKENGLSEKQKARESTIIEMEISTQGISRETKDTVMVKKY
jgi:hypothetical protein